MINPRTSAAIKEFISKITSPDGFNHGAATYHAKINAETGFYQVVEYSDDFPSTTDLQIREAPFRFQRTPPPSPHEKAAIAIKNEDFDAFKTIVDTPGFDLEKKFGARDIPLLWSAVVSRNPAFVKYLLEKGASPNMKFKTGEGPLPWAISNGAAETTMEILLDAPTIDVNVQSGFGETPLANAVKRHW